MDRRQPVAAYVHLPFCRRRCHYCDFPIVAVGDKPERADAAAESYVSLLLREIRATPAVAGGDRPLQSLYFGGGTPSLTPPRLIAQIITEIRARYGLEDDAECTLEMDPGTFDAARLAAYLDAGGNRVSIGVQSFDHRVLKASGRVHTLAQIAAALALVLDSSRFPRLLSVSIDLIGGFPQLSLSSWHQVLERAIATGVHHLSVYDLQVEPATFFGHLDRKGILSLPPDDVSAQMFRDGSSRLRAAGFEHYEVSSYGRLGHRSRHNLAYWANEPFWAFGLGATSYVSDRRLARPRAMNEYEAWVTALEAPGGWAEAQHSQGELEPYGGVEELKTWLMLRLRTSEGISLQELPRRYPDGLGDQVVQACVSAAAAMPAEWVELGADSGSAEKVRRARERRDLAARRKDVALATAACLGNSSLRLRDPEGWLFSNSAISSIFNEIDLRWTA